MGDSSSVGEWCGRLIDESRSASCLCHACLRPPLAARRGPCLLSRPIQGACPKPPGASPVSPEPCGDTPGRIDYVPADMSWVLLLPGPRFFPWNPPGRWAARPSCVPPDMSPCHPVTQPRVSDGTVGPSALDRASGPAWCLPSLSRHIDRHVYRHFYRQFYRRWDLALKLALKLALHAGRRAVVGRGPGPRQGRQGGGSATALPRRCLWAKCAFEQRFLAHSPSRPGSARPRPGVPPLAPCPPLDAADLGHSPRCAVPASARGRQP